MILRTTIVLCASLACLCADEVPKIFSGYFEKNVPVKGQIGMVLPPPEIDKYIEKVQAAAKKDPRWFDDFAKHASPGTPLPFDARLGLTQAEYDDYSLLWSKRQFRSMEEVMLMLRQSSGTDAWSITCTGRASVFSTLRYTAKDDTFRSPNGALSRIKDIKAAADSMLGEWSGSEWEFNEETGLGKTKESFAIGQYADRKFGLLVYRAQELSTGGSRLLDNSIVVRFALTKAEPAKESSATTKPSPKK